MRIALLTPGGVDRSGTDRVIPCILWLIERLTAAGDDVQVFALRQEPLPGRWPLLGAHVHNAGRRPHSLTMLRMLLSEHRKTPFDAIHVFWASSCGVVGALASKLLGVPCILTLPGGDLMRLDDIGYGSRRSLYGRLQLRVAVTGADVVTAPSGAMCLQAAALGITAQRVPLGVALDLWPPRAPKRREPGATLQLLHVASLNRVKDQATLLHACARVKAAGTAFDLTVIGEDTLGGSVQRHATELGLAEEAHFIGYKRHEAMRPWFEHADILLVSSRHEAGPLVTLEAAIAGVPTIGTAVGHIADFAPDAAIAVPVADSEALATAILALATNEERRLHIAVTAQARAIAEDADFTAHSFRRLYQDQLLNRRRANKVA